MLSRKRGGREQQCLVDDRRTKSQEEQLPFEARNPSFLFKGETERVLGLDTSVKMDASATIADLTDIQH